MFRDLVELFNLIYIILLRGGWIGFMIALAYMFWKIYVDYIQIKWYRTLKWEFLKITVPKENEKSPLAFEEVLNELHSIQEHITWAEKYLEGQFQIWLVWEVTSIGGAIGNYVRVLPKHRHVFEAAVYSQYPQAEIADAEDYFDKLPRYSADTSEFDIFAFSFRYLKDNAYPIKTYYDFEHSTAETFVDPIAGMWEELSRLSPYEMYVIQFVLRPIGDEHWKEHSLKIVKKLKGEPEEHGADWFGAIMNTVLGPILDIFVQPAAGEHSAASEKYEPPSLMLHKTEGEKAVIAAIEKKISKWGYQTKIHCLYVAPKEKYDFGRINRAVVGAFKSFGGANLNALKPLLRRWTKVNYFLLKELEQPIVQLRVKFRKRKYMSLIRRRWYFWGPPSNIMSTEEIASILHFPHTEVMVPHIERVTVSKVQPPHELPISDENILG